MKNEILVVGSVAFDDIVTPFGKITNALGGSATYFSVSASHFCKVKLVAVVGEDFTDEHHKIFRKHNVDIAGLEKAAGKTFKWVGKYEQDINRAITIRTDLNVFEKFSPKIPESYKKIPYVFLANIDPDLQYEVLAQMKHPKLVALDTMNLWIDIKKPSLLKLLKKVDIFVINEGEARQLSGEVNLIKAANKVLAMGPKVLVVKRGEYGVMCFTKTNVFAAPGFPLESVFDPTGAGDSFAGGFMGYIVKNGKLSDQVIRQALIMGNVMGSYCCETFSQAKLSSLSWAHIKQRFNEFKKLTHFENI
jgi:sugar/nucleoside kinase (ribokinase family)